MFEQIVSPELKEIEELLGRRFVALVKEHSTPLEHVPERESEMTRYGAYDTRPEGPMHFTAVEFEEMQEIVADSPTLDFYYPITIRLVDGDSSIYAITYDAVYGFADISNGYGEVHNQSDNTFENRVRSARALVDWLEHAELTPSGRGPRSLVQF